MDTFSMETLLTKRLHIFINF